MDEFCDKLDFLEVLKSLKHVSYMVDVNWIGLRLIEMLALGSPRLPLILFLVLGTVELDPM